MRRSRACLPTARGIPLTLVPARYLFDATKLNSVRGRRPAHAQPRAHCPSSCAVYRADSREVLIHDGVSGANLSFRLVVQRSDTFGDVLAQVLGMLGLREDTDMNTTFIITDAGGAMWPRTIQALAALESLGGCPELWLNKRAKLPYHELETFVPQSAVFLAPPVVGEKGAHQGPAAHAHAAPARHAAASR